jgi:hypothetical protein
VVAGLHRAHHPALQVGEGLLEERGAGGLAERVTGAADRAVFGCQGLGELAG